MKQSLHCAEQVLLSSIWILFVLCMAPGGVFGKDINLSAGIGFEFATGKYGTDQTTDSFSIPLTIRYDPSEQIELELIVPYIYQSNGSTTSTGMFRFRNGRNGVAANGSVTNGQGRSGGAQNSDPSRSESGVGDTSLKLGYVVWPEGKTNPRLKPLLYAQFPTADEDKGLGTGKFSGGAGLEIAKWFGDWYLYGEGIYIFQEKSAEFALKDYFSYEAGLAYQMTDRFRPSLLVMGATAPSDFSSAIAEVRLKTGFRLTGRAGLEAYLATGLTSQSPDFGAGVAVFYEF